MIVMKADEKIAHLGFIQGVINRMGNNSFLIKGWAITLVAGVLSLLATKGSGDFVYVLSAIVIPFWVLDAFYLYQEKLYRKLYDKVASNANISKKFSMNAYEFKGEVDCLLRVMFSKTLLGYYGINILVIIIFMIKSGFFSCTKLFLFF